MKEKKISRNGFVREAFKSGKSYETVMKLAIDEFGKDDARIKAVVNWIYKHEFDGKKASTKVAESKNEVSEKTDSKSKVKRSEQKENQNVKKSSEDKVDDGSSKKDDSLDDF